jgi:hypothetical protein
MVLMEFTMLARVGFLVVVEGVLWALIAVALRQSEKLLAETGALLAVVAGEPRQQLEQLQLNHLEGLGAAA